MRIFLGLLLLILSVVSGYYLSIKYVKKREFFEELFTLHKKLVNEISFSQKTLPEIIDNDFNLLKNILINSDKNKLLNEITYLNEDEKNFIKQYFDSVGVSDKASQLNYLKSVEDQLKGFANNSINDEKKYKTLYLKIGVLIGLVLFVIVL